MNSNDDKLGLEGEFPEEDLPLLIRRYGMSDWNDGSVRILDRRKLPHDEVYVDCTSVEDVATAIEDMAIQGAFSISIAAGYGLALTDLAKDDPTTSLRKAADRLIRTRPTGLALRRMVEACITQANNAINSGEDPVAAIVAHADTGAAALARQGWKTGQRVSELLHDGAGILTHCFPDRSFCYLLMEAKRTGKRLTVFCSETRPYLQGSRLTAYCAQQAGFDTRVVTDGMGAYLMRNGDIDAFITAADHVCMDGTVCNKIGTYAHALAASANNIPYYVLRQSGPDTESADESFITIEQRDGDAILEFAGERIAPEGVSGVYPGFDITPPELVRGIVTDRGVFDANKIADYVNTRPFVTDAVV